MEAVAKINEKLLDIRHELEPYDAVKQFPKPYNPLTDELPADVDNHFNVAIDASINGDEAALLRACYDIEAHFKIPATD